MSYKYVRLIQSDLEELDYMLCSQQRQLTSIINNSEDIEEIKEYMESLETLNKIKTRVRKEMEKK